MLDKTGLSDRKPHRTRVRITDAAWLAGYNARADRFARAVSHGAAGHRPITTGTTLVVKDTMQRATWNRPDTIGVGRPDDGLAFSVPLAIVELDD